ncbi:regulator of chromosome condensation [Pseudoscourfieldia marina]
MLLGTLLICLLLLDAAAAGSLGSVSSGSGAVSTSSGEHKVLYAWGRNNAGQLGVGHKKDVAEPMAVDAFLAKDIRALAVGGANEDGQRDGFSLAVAASGVLYAWGSNAYGQLGTGDTNDRITMVPVFFPSALGSGKVSVTIVGAGVAFAVALTKEGAVYSWGDNERGQLGLGDRRRRLLPEQLGGSLAGETVISIACGAYHSVALTSDGGLHAWGANDRGQLGLGPEVSHQLIPKRLLGAITGVKFVNIDAGTYHSLAASKGGEVYCWGANDHSQLGLGDLDARDTPHAIMHKFSRGRVTKVAAGDRHSLALTDSGEVFAWGSADCGQLGVEIKERGRKYIGYPRKIESLKANRIKAGFATSLATLTSGRVFVWGCNNNGELGLNDVAARSSPHVFPSPVPGQQWAVVAPGANHALGALKTGELYGWGKNTRGQLGLSITSKVEMKPNLIASTSSSNVETFASGGSAYEYQGHTMAMTSNGRVFTWGWDGFGQLGIGTVSEGISTPLRLFSLELPVKPHHFAAGAFNSAVACTRKGVPQLYSWGPNYGGQLGMRYLELGPIPRPTKVDAVEKGMKFEVVELGYYHGVGLTSTGKVYTWGRNSHGQLGTGDDKDRAKPTLLAGLAAFEVKAVAAGMMSSYAVTSSGRVYAWGYNEHYELGLGEGIDRNAPQLVQGLGDSHNVTQLAPGGYHVIASTADGRLFSWGHNGFGQCGLGKASAAPVKVPTEVTAMPEVAERTLSAVAVHGQPTIASGMWHSVAASASGEVYTWGRSHYGCLGHGSENSRESVAEPTAVDALSSRRAVGVAAGAASSFANVVVE